MFDHTGNGLGQTEIDHFDDDDDEGPSNDADLGQPTWIELGHGFPADGIGHDLAAVDDRGEAALVASALLGVGPVVAETDTGPFTGVHAAHMVAFNEFLAGSAFAVEEREWLVDATAREFTDNPSTALEQMVPIANAVEMIPDLDPLERADSRLKALTKMYLTEPIRERLAMPETPVMQMLKAYNPAVVIDPAGVVVVADALDARRQINELVLLLGQRSLDQVPNLRTEMTSSFLDAPAPMKAELAGSQIRLVTLRTWLSLLPQYEIDQLRARMTDVIDTATDLDMVALQLCFRSTMEALVDDDDDDDED